MLTFWKVIGFRADLATKQHEQEHETELFIRVFSCSFVAKIPSSAQMSTQPSYRFSQVLISLFNLTDRNFNNPVLAKNRSAADVQKVMELLNRQPTADSASLYPEFSKMSLPALIAELRRHVEGDEERIEIGSVLASLTGGAWGNAEPSDVKAMAM